MNGPGEREKYQLDKLGDDYARGMRLLDGRPSRAPEALKPSPARQKAAALIALTLVAVWLALSLAPLLSRKTNVTVKRAEQTRVHAAQEAPAAEPPKGAVRISTASAQELTTLPGIGPVLAERIVSEREQRGAFYYPEDLLCVRGIGPELLKRLTPYLLFEESCP